MPTFTQRKSANNIDNMRRMQEPQTPSWWGDWWNSRYIGAVCGNKYDRIDKNGRGCKTPGVRAHVLRADGPKGDNMLDDTVYLCDTWFDDFESTTTVIQKVEDQPDVYDRVNARTLISQGKSWTALAVTKRIPSLTQSPKAPYSSTSYYIPATRTRTAAASSHLQAAILSPKVLPADMAWLVERRGPSGSLDPTLRSAWALPRTTSTTTSTSPSPDSWSNAGASSSRSLKHIGLAVRHLRAKRPTTTTRREMTRTTGSRTKSATPSVRRSLARATRTARASAQKTVC